MKFKMTALEKKWVLYDVGNSAFTMLVATIFPNLLQPSGRYCGNIFCQLSGVLGICNLHLHPVCSSSWADTGGGLRIRRIIRK